MSTIRQLGHDRGSSAVQDESTGGAAGKRTRTEALPAVQRRARGSDLPAPSATAGGTVATGDDPFGLHLVGTVQRAATGGPTAGDEQVHAAAQHGVSGPAGALPHADVIQQAFGHHDVSAIRAHTGAAAAEGAAAMGAHAFAAGDDVAFAPGATDLHTAAHEAAHVVQQRGGVQLKGGVGADGDAYERHADAVADRVVAGGSAEGLLDTGPGGRGPAAGAGAVQRKIRVDAIDGGDEFDPEIDFVQSTWGFTPSEKQLYLEWLKDDEQHRYPTKDKLKEAIRHASVSGKLKAKRDIDLKSVRGQKGAADKMSPDDELLQQIGLLARQSNDVAATLTKGKTLFQLKRNLLGDDRTGIHMDHTIEFHTDDTDARYIRFVKSSRLMSGKIAVTVPGYVTYGLDEKVTPSLVRRARNGKLIDQDARSQLTTLTRAAMGKAAWSLDGPHHEFEKPAENATSLKNIDTPGMDASMGNSYPYILITEFIGVLFDPGEGRILNVTRYADELIEFGEHFDEMMEEHGPKKPPTTGGGGSGKLGGNNPYI